MYIPQVVKVILRGSILLVSIVLLAGCLPQNLAANQQPGSDSSLTTPKPQKSSIIPSHTPKSENRDQNSPTKALTKEQLMPPPEMTIDAAKKYSAILKTSVGNITIELTATATPKTVNNFVSLARANFYNQTIFHRIINGFMIQGGDPNGDGTGGPGYKFDDEPFSGEYTRGAVAMANAGPNTNGSQYFIMHQDYQLPKNYVIFGHVTSGLDVVDKIAEASVTTNANNEPSKPIAPVSVSSIQIVEE